MSFQIKPNEKAAYYSPILGACWHWAEVLVKNTCLNGITTK